MLNIESASNPIYASADKTCVQLQVKFQEFDEIMPFGATSFDSMPYGVELYNRAIAGEFGSIAPFVDPDVADKPQPVVVGAQTL